MTRAVVTVVRVVVVATVCILLIQGARAWGSANDRNRRAHEIRKLEALVRDREQDVALLRARLGGAVGVSP